MTQSEITALKRFKRDVDRIGLERAREIASSVRLRDYVPNIDPAIADVTVLQYLLLADVESPEGVAVKQGADAAYKGALALLAKEPA